MATRQRTIDNLQSYQPPSVTMGSGSRIQGNVTGEIAIKCGLEDLPVKILDFGNGQLTMPLNSVVFINVDRPYARSNVNITCQSQSQSPPTSVSIPPCRQMY